jgi:hypothetical protein
MRSDWLPQGAFVLRADETPSEQPDCFGRSDGFEGPVRLIRVEARVFSPTPTTPWTPPLGVVARPVRILVPEEGQVAFVFRRSRDFPSGDIGQLR